MFAGSPSLPTMVVTGSPGNARIKKNVSVAVAQMANRENRNRRNRYRCMIKFALSEDSGSHGYRLSAFFMINEFREAVIN